MDLTQLSALEAGLKLFAKTQHEIARRSGYSVTYVQKTLSGSIKNWKNRPACLSIIREAKNLYEERVSANEVYLNTLKKKTA